MKPSSAKNKGRLLQQWVRDKMLQHCPELTSDDIRSTGMGQTGADVQLSTAAKARFPLAIECKSNAKHRAYAFYEQAEEHAKDHLGNKPVFPVVFIKQNGKQPLAIVDGDLFLQLIESFWRKS